MIGPGARSPFLGDTNLALIGVATKAEANSLGTFIGGQMTATSIQSTLETITLADGGPEKFTILYTTRTNGRCLHLLVDEDEMALAIASGVLPPVYAFEETNCQLIPLDQKGTDQVIHARKRDQDDFGHCLNPIATVQFPGDQCPVRFEEEVVAPLDAGNRSGRIVALHNVTDDHDIRVVVCWVDTLGKKAYEPLPEAFTPEALEIARYLSGKRRLLRTLN